jgi:hypothetical protein
MNHRTFSKERMEEIAHSLALNAVIPHRSHVVDLFIAKDIIKPYAIKYNAIMDELEEYNANPTGYTSQ